MKGGVLLDLQMTNLVVYIDEDVVIVVVVVQLLSHVQLFATPWTAACQASCPSPSPGVCSSSCPLNWWCHPTISSSVTLFSFYLPSFPASGPFLMSQLFTSGSQNIGDSASASVLLKSKDSQESSPALQFKGINSSALFLLHCLALTTVPDYWKDHAVVHSLSRVQLFATPWTAACQASLSSISRSLLKFMSIESVTISSSVIHFSSCLQSFLASVSFPMSQLFASGGQRFGASASALVLLMNIQDWFPLGLTSLTSLLSKGLSRVFSSTTVQKHQFFGTQPSWWSNSHIHTWLLEKPQLCLRQTFVGKVMPLLFNMLSRLAIAILPRSKHLLISWL